MTRAPRHPFLLPHNPLRRRARLALGTLACAAFPAAARRVLVEGNPCVPLATKDVEPQGDVQRDSRHLCDRLWQRQGASPTCPVRSGWTSTPTR